MEGGTSLQLLRTEGNGRSTTQREQVYNFAKKQNEDLRSKTNQFCYLQSKCRTAMFGCFDWTQLETQTKPGWRTAPSGPSHLRRGRLLRFRSSNAAHISTAQYDGCSSTLVQLSSYSCTICKGQRYLRVCTKQSLSIYILDIYLGYCIHVHGM